MLTGRAWTHEPNGSVTARIVEAIFHDEALVAPIGILYKPRFQVTLSLPAVIRQGGVSKVLPPAFSAEDDAAVEASAAAIADALVNLRWSSLGCFMGPQHAVVEIAPRLSAPT